MNIAQLLSSIKSTDLNLEINGLCLNTNTAQVGDVFIALPGQVTHGVDYIDQAVNKGCVAVLGDIKNIVCPVPYIYIESLLTHLPTLCASFYHAAQKVELVGITGTNGKTSVASFINQLLTHLGVKNGVIGTLGMTDSDNISLNTTPDIITLYKTLHEYYLNDIRIAILEVSSHGLKQNRITGLNFIQAILTNLSHDHLDYHHTLAQYQAAKGKLFSISSLESVVINRDDTRYLYFLNLAKGKQQITYSIDDFATITANQYGFVCQLDQFIFELPLLGGFNLHNVLAALYSVRQLGFKQEKIIPILTTLKPPLGRMQQIAQRPIWVDYAHTPDALENALTTIKTHYPNTSIRLIFGCGGNRDQAKRAKMGKIASKLADSIILTSDNPRSEDPQNIIDDILTGIDINCKVQIMMDRKLAIQTAVTTLLEGECLLIAGKGHETTQQWQDKIIALSDIEIAKNATR